MLEKINIIEAYDDVQKNHGQLKLFLVNMRDQLLELEERDYITTEDEFALCNWQYVLEDVYKNYRDLVTEFENVLFETLGIMHVLRLRSAVDNIFVED